MIQRHYAGLLLVALSCLEQQASQFHLITFLYPEQKIERAQEYCLCLKKNSIHPLIASIDIFFDLTKDQPWNEAQSEAHALLITTIKDLQTQGARIRIIPKQGRPTYGDAFRLANEQYPNQTIIISNGDIYFNETLNILKEKGIDTNALFCITRYEPETNGSLRLRTTKGFSHDSWIFKTPFTISGADNILMGSKHCDGKIAYLAKKNRITCFNPAFYIETCHVHNSAIRNYNQGEPAPGHIMAQISPTTWPSTCAKAPTE